MKPIPFLAALVAASLLRAAPGIAPDVVASGGTSATGGRYAVAGTVGQAVASGPSPSGGRYAVHGGFWPAAVARSAGLPDLVVAPDPAGIRVTWESSDPSWVLQATSDLANPSGWKAVAGVQSTGNGTHRLVQGTAGTATYFRLAR